MLPIPDSLECQTSTPYIKMGANHKYGSRLEPTSIGSHSLTHKFHLVLFYAPQSL